MPAPPPGVKLDALDLHAFLSAAFVTSIGDAEAVIQQYPDSHGGGAHPAVAAADAALGRSLNRGLLKGLQLDWDRDSSTWLRFVTAIATAQMCVPRGWRASFSASRLHATAAGVYTSHGFVHALLSRLSTTHPST